MQEGITTEKSNRIIVTVLGLDKIGIIAWVSGRLAEHSISIQDISQTILQGFFTMIMIVDMTSSTISLGDLAELLKNEGQERGLKVRVQHEDVFSFMHRV